MAWITTTQLVDALRVKLAAIEPKFDRVEPYLHRDLVEALTDLRASKSNRICFIVPAGDDYLNERAGPSLRSRRTASITLLIADRNVRGIQAKAGFGGSDNPGVIVLKDAILNALTGEDLDLKGVLVMPGAGEPFELEDDDSAATGRQCWAQTIEIECWWSITSRPRRRTAEVTEEG